MIRTQRRDVTFGDADAWLAEAWRDAAIDRCFELDACRDARLVSANAGASESDIGGKQDND